MWLEGKPEAETNQEFKSECLLIYQWQGRFGDLLCSLDYINSDSANKIRVEKLNLDKREKQAPFYDL